MSEARAVEFIGYSGQVSQPDQKPQWGHFTAEFMDEVQERFRRWLAEHDAALIEGLAGKLSHPSEAPYEVEAQRNQYAAVVEKVRAWMDEPGDADEIAFAGLDSILASAPADILREHDAELIEGLAGKLAHPEHAPYEVWASGAGDWLRDQARQRREEQNRV